MILPCKLCEIQDDFLFSFRKPECKEYLLLFFVSWGFLSHIWTQELLDYVSLQVKPSKSQVTVLGEMSYLRNLVLSNLKNGMQAVFDIWKVSASLYYISTLLVDEQWVIQFLCWCQFNKCLQLNLFPVLAFPYPSSHVYLHTWFSGNSLTSVILSKRLLLNAQIEPRCENQEKERGRELAHESTAKVEFVLKLLFEYWEFPMWDSTSRKLVHLLCEKLTVHDSLTFIRRLRNC